jgi:hypothetical protein
MDPPDPPDFLKRIVDFDRLLQGENRDTTHQDDVEHWFSVYADLVNFKERLLSETKSHIHQVPATESELGTHDVPFLEAELGRLRSGLAFWAARRDTGRQLK